MCCTLHTHVQGVTPVKQTLTDSRAQGPAYVHSGAVSASQHAGGMPVGPASCGTPAMGVSGATHGGSAMAPSAQHEFADLSHHEYKGRAYPTAPGSEVQPLQRARSRTSDQQSVRKLILNDSDGAADGNEV